MRSGSPSTAESLALISVFAAALYAPQAGAEGRDELELCVDLHDNVELALARSICSKLGRSSSRTSEERARANTYWAHAVLIAALSETNSSAATRLRDEAVHALTAAFCEEPRLIQGDAARTDDRFAQDLAEWLSAPASGFEAAFLTAQRRAPDSCPRVSDAVDPIVVGGALATVAATIAAVASYATAQKELDAAQVRIDDAARSGALLDFERVRADHASARSGIDRTNLMTGLAAGLAAATTTYFIFQVIGQRQPAASSIPGSFSVTIDPASESFLVSGRW